MKIQKLPSKNIEFNGPPTWPLWNDIEIDSIVVRPIFHSIMIGDVLYETPPVDMPIKARMQYQAYLWSFPIRWLQRWRMARSWRPKSS